MALSCDLIYAAASASFADGHAKYGMMPAIGGAQSLVRNIGSFRAKELLFTGDAMTPQQLMDAGLVNEVVDDAALTDAVQAVAQTLGKRSPAGIAALKQMANAAFDLSWEDAARFELALNARHTHRGIPAEGIAAFLSKTDPRFSA